MESEIIQINSEVLYSKQSIAMATHELIDELKELASKNTRSRARICMHKSIDESLHEMLIVHKKDCYVRPHMHPGKSESLHVVEGSADLILFNQQGGIDKIIPMGDYSSEKLFYYRLNDSVYHSLFIRSEWLVFHEVTNGPFRREDTVFGAWSPDSENIALGISYINKMVQI